MASSAHIEANLGQLLCCMPEITQVMAGTSGAILANARSTISVFGPAVSGLIVATVGAEWVFGINGASFVVSAFFLARLSVPERERGPRKAFLADLAEGWREVRSRPWVGAALVNFSIVNIGIASYFVLGPLIVEEELSGPSTWAIAMTGGSIGGILGAMVALRFKPTYPLRWSFGLIALTAVQLLGLIPPLPAVGLAVLALLTVTSIQISGTFGSRQEEAPLPGIALITLSVVENAILIYAYGCIPEMRIQ